VVVSVASIMLSNKKLLVEILVCLLVKTGVGVLV